MAKVESRVQNLETRLQLLSKLNILYNAKAYRKLYILRSKRMFPLDSGFWILISKLSALVSRLSILDSGLCYPTIPKSSSSAVFDLSLCLHSHIGHRSHNHSRTHSHNLNRSHSPSRSRSHMLRSHNRIRRRN